MRGLNAYLKIIFVFVMISGCNAQPVKPGEKKNRQPVVAGQFYPANPDELRRDLKEYFALAMVKPDPSLRAVLSPHAGFVFSGQVAASAFAAIDTSKTYKRIFVITSSHRLSFAGASVYTSGNYETPLGEVEVDTALGNELCRSSALFSNRSDAHLSEHSLEVQLPFLQFRMKQPFKLVPIVLGTQDSSVCKKIADVLKPYFTGENLFVISTDFSHYPEYNKATDSDKRVATSLLFNDPVRFRDTLAIVESSGTPGLATGMCGWASVITLLYMTEDDSSIKYSLLEYRNSGDSKYGDKKRVVGYWSVKVSGKDKAGSFSMSESDKKELLAISRKTLEQFIIKNSMPVKECNSSSAVLQSQMGAFVTLHKKGSLRGCIGQFKPTVPLCELVSDLTVSSSTRDYRFPPVTASELADIDIEISVLTPMEKIDDVKKIELGKHGIYIVKGGKGGTFLPQVATDTGWSLDEFLGHCARDKAGIGWDGWKDADIYIYEAIIFGEKDVEKTK